MEIIAEVVLQIVLWIVELLFTLIGEGLFNWGRNVAAYKRLKSNARPSTAGPVLTALGYGAFGVLFGLVSVWIMPAQFITSPTLRVLNLVGSSLLAGFLLAQWRRLRAAPGAQTDFTRDFINGGLLAFALAATRLMLAR